jgi:hypothetical protein
LQAALKVTLEDVQRMGELGNTAATEDPVMLPTKLRARSHEMHEDANAHKDPENKIDDMMSSWTWV